MAETKETVEQQTNQPGWFAKRSTVVKAFLLILPVVMLLMLISERSLVITPLFITLRIYAPITLVITAVLTGIYSLLARKSKTLGMVVTGIMIGVLLSLTIFAWVSSWDPYDFVSSWVRYNSLKRVEITKLPETDYEAMQSKISINTVGQQEIKETGNQMSVPHRVRIGKYYPWTMVKEPVASWKYADARLWSGIEKVYCIPAETSSVDFSEQNQSKVDFAIGETLLLGEEAEIAVMRALPFSYLFNTEVGEPRFMKNDSGQWVQVIPLVRWQGTGFWGIFFPQPQFGGVQVIKQTDGHVETLFITKSFWKRAYFGAGTTYTSEEMRHIPYLCNQNLLPREVKESIAHSFRFQKGLTAPIYFNHDGDTRIPDIDIPELDPNLRSLPLTGFFRMSQVDSTAKDMLYDYYGLEPYDSTKSGLMVSLYIPSDGSPNVYVYQHVDDAISGISAVPGSARESAKQYDWNQSKIADVRPYTKNINGRVQHFWLFSVVTHAKNKGYTSGSTSLVGLLDPVKKRVYWVSPDSVATWPAQIK
jgi:hypothetical protein